MRIVRESAAGESAREAAWKVGHEHPARYVVPGGFSRYRGMSAAIGGIQVVPRYFIALKPCASGRLFLE